MIMNIPEVKNIFNSFITYERYITAITNYFKQLTKPRLDNNYIPYRKKVGKIHNSIRLTEEWFIGSYIRVFEYLIPSITKRFVPRPLSPNS